MPTLEQQLFTILSQPGYKTLEELSLQLYRSSDDADKLAAQQLITRLRQKGLEIKRTSAYALVERQGE